MIKRLNIAVLLILILFIGCATKTTQQNLFASLDSTITVYNTTFDIVSDLDARGKIKEEYKPTIKKNFQRAEIILKESADLLHIYLMVPDSTNKEIFESSILEVMDILAQIKEYLYE